MTVIISLQPSKVQFKDKTANISLRLHLNSKGVSIETLLDE
jgi:hypothetical protein